MGYPKKISRILTFSKIKPFINFVGLCLHLEEFFALHHSPQHFDVCCLRRALNVFYQALFSLCQICSTIFLVMQEKVLKFLSGKYTELTFYLVHFSIYSMLFDEI